jgi:hypothetical protein
MWFWPVNEMTEIVSGMPAPQFGGESSWILDLVKIFVDAETDFSNKVQKLEN